MHYVSALSLTKAFGVKPLFSGLSFHIEEGDKIALVARNGAGKSTLLKILAGKEDPDEGKVWIHKDVRVALFEQEPAFREDESVLDNIFHHKHPVIEAVKSYEAAQDSSDASALSAALAQMEELGAWDFDHRVQQIFSRLRVHQLHQILGTLSGGQRKRVALARTLIDIEFEQGPVFLIMDEPTNHLDVEMVEWLERFLGQQRITLLMVTHDRYFLDNVCREIWELAGGRLYQYKTDYAGYLERKAARVENGAAETEKAKNRYRRELEWMRRQPKARTTKARSRVEAFEEVEARAKEKAPETELKLSMKMSRLGGKVLELKKVYKQFGSLRILQGFDYTFKRGERVGIIGRNGTGKSTFLRILQGLEPPDSGKINPGETVVFGHYSQAGLDTREDMRVIEYVKRIAEHFPLAEGGSLSAAQFLNLFLFPPEQQYTFISRLSGGEKRRLHLLSVLFANPNFLILDEPTNDLDLPTLSVLEDFLASFSGCLVIVSHDRYFMDRLVDHLLVFEGDGKIRDFPGNYSQYREEELQQKAEYSAAGDETKVVSSKPATAPDRQQGARKMSYREKREFEALGEEILALEDEKATLTSWISSGKADYAELRSWAERVAVIEALLDEKEMRWLELSELGA